MISEREYLHLDEAEQIPGISKFDIIEMIRSQKINAYAWIPEHKLFAIAKFKQYSKASTLGSFLYEGIVSFDPSAAIEILDGNKTVSMTYVEISEPQKIYHWSSEAPNIKFPNNRYTNHVPYNEVPDFEFLACTKPTSLSDKTAPLYEQAIEVAKAFNADEDALANGQKLMTEALEKFSTNIESSSIKIKPNQFRFKKSELPTTKIPLIEKEIELSAPNPLDQIILEIIKNGTNRSDHIWNTLKVESKQEIFDRKYDPYGVIEEVSNERIIWKGISKERSISRRTFINKVSKLRKHV